MGLSRSVVTVSLVGLMVAGVLAGCLGGNKKSSTGAEDEIVQFVEFTAARTLEEQLAALPDVETERLWLDVGVDIHLVFVGWDPAQIDQEKLLKRLPTEYQPVDRLRSIVVNRNPDIDEDRFQQEGLTYRWNFVVHFAPDEFGAKLFENALAHAETKTPNAYLVDYDAEQGQDRLEAGEEIMTFDASDTERWIAGNRSAYGLEFAKPSYTFFLVDSWTKGWFPHDETYYFWHFKEDLYQTDSVSSLRGWGGNYDFLWMDYSTAPSNSGNEASPTHANDPPVWEYEGGMRAEITTCSDQGETLGGAGAPAPNQCTRVARKLWEELSNDTRVGLQMHVMPSFLYHPTYKPTYFLNIHLFHDAGAVVQDRNALEQQLDLESVLDRLHSQIPWANFDGLFKTYQLPTDDPEFAAMLQRAKAEAAGTYVPTPPVKHYVDAHPEKYLLGPPDAYQVKVVYVNFEGHYAFAFPVLVAGIASSNPEGKPWGVLGSHADALVAAGSAFDYGSLTAHEVGHFWGLNHPHDGTMKDPETGDYRENVDFTWDQVSTPLSYRMVPYYSDQMDRDHMARGMTAMNVNEALKTLRAAYENEAAAGLARPSAVLAKEATIAETSINTAITLFQRGLWVDGVTASIAALEASQRAVNATGGLRLATEVTEWDGTVAGPAWNAPALNGDSDVPIAATFDYQEFAVLPGDETVRIRVDWTNGAASQCDMFVGWNFLQPSATSDRVSLLLTGADSPAPVPFGDDVGVWDIREQFAATGPQFEEYVLDLDDDGVREVGRIFAGAGTMRPGACPYHVTVEVSYREGRGLRGGDGDATPAAETPGGNAANAPRTAEDAAEAVRRLFTV